MHGIVSGKEHCSLELYDLGGCDTFLNIATVDFYPLCGLCILKVNIF